MDFVERMKATVGDISPQRSIPVPIWKGPEKDGITFSLLSRYLVCKERFRLLVVHGLRPAPSFNHRIEYGSMWHACEEALAAKVPGVIRWESSLADYCDKLANLYPLDREQIEHWYNVCLVQFPAYIDFWQKHPDVLDRRPVVQEEKFEVPYSLPSGRIVKLRGKWDSVDVIGKGPSAGVYLQENKTKGQIDERLIQRQLTFDLQTMIYFIALGTASGSDLARKGWTNKVFKKGATDIALRAPLCGVRYNVVKRPLSGGKGTIVRHKATLGTKCSKCKGNGCPKCKGMGRVGAKPAETEKEYYDRVGKYIWAEPKTHFMRWKIEVGATDVIKFKRQCLDPILENLCDDWEWWSWAQDTGQDAFDFLVRDNEERFQHHRTHHYRHPFGVYNVLDEGRASDLDEYLATGSMAGLAQVENLFPELT